MENKLGSMEILNALIFDGESSELVEGSIRIENGHIQEIGSSLSKSVGNIGRVIDARGRVVIPGFIDNHFHAYGISLDMLKLEGSPRSYVALKAKKRLESALRRGFTTVRDVAGGDIGVTMAIAEGLIDSPNYFFTGPALSQSGGHGDARSAELDTCSFGNHGVEVVDGVENLRVAVRERFRSGAHAIKIMASGGVVSDSDPIRAPQYSGEEIRAVTDEAKRRGSYVAAHAYSPEAIAHAVLNGVRSIEHGNLLDEDSALLMAKHEAVLVPTLAAYRAMAEHGQGLGMSKVGLEKNNEVLSAGKVAIELAMGHGVKVGFGTDLMGDLEEFQLNGIALQHEVQGTLELLRSLTSRNAEILRMENLGKVKQGYKADLLILAQNPFLTPDSLWTLTPERVVIKGGSLLE